jgi:hypothetical protein
VSDELKHLLLGFIAVDVTSLPVNQDETALPLMSDDFFVPS